MNEKHRTSLQLSQKLKAAGAPQVSEWYWVRQPQSAFSEWICIQKYEMEEGLKFAPAFRYSDPVSAFHVGELGEMLPIWSSTERKEDEKWHGYIDKDEATIGPFDTEAEARGKMYLYLLEHHLITPEQLKEAA